MLDTNESVSAPVTAEDQAAATAMLSYPILPDYVKSWTLICICQAALLVKSRTSAQACKARVL